MDLSESKRTRRLICLTLALATIGVYARVAGFDFVDFDDPDYVTENPMVKMGVTFKGLIWAFTHNYASNWHPLTWISHMLDCQIFGLHGGGPHLVNVLLHTANVVLLFILLQRITGALWRSAIVAALFALHPLHVESVAWISERKDVLSTLFGLLTLLAYAQYVSESRVHPASAGAGATRRPKPIWFALALCLYALGLMAKPMLVTLPFVMLLLDFWPLRRVESPPPQAKDSEPELTEQDVPCRSTPAPRRRRAKSLIMEKIPFFVLSFASSAITFYVQKNSGAMASTTAFPFGWRVYVAIESYVWYLQKIFWPVHLAMFYPLETHRPVLPFVCASLILLVISVIAVVMAKRRPFLLMGWLWFLGTLVPVIGLVQVGAQETADRYSYLPSIGLFIAAIWWGSELVSRLRFKQAMAAALVGIVLALLAAATVVQAGYWKNSLTLFHHAIEVTRNNVTALNNLGVALYGQGRYKEALEAYQSALQVRPAGDIYKNIGLLLDKTGKPEEALTQYEQAVELDPKSAELQHCLATALTALGRKDQALEHHQEAARLKPENAVYQNDLGAALVAADKKADALAHYQEAVRLLPESPQFQNNLATALARSGQVDAAIAHYQMAIRDDPKFAEAYSNLGALHLSQHRLNDAAREYSTAVRLNPTNAIIRLNTGLVFAKVGRLDEAVNQFAEAVRIDPASSEAQFEYGHSLLLQGQFQRARDELSKAVQMEPDNASAQFFLGVACLESHSVEDGLKHLKEAARLRPNWAEPLNAQARVLATSEDEKVRNGPEAVRLAEEAANLTSRRQPAILFTLSAAYAEAGRFDDAVAAANEAATLAQSSGQTSLAIQIGQALELYRSHQPFRDVGR